MSRRQRLWSLLLLAAVFVMHGVQCVAADPHSGPAALAPAIASAVMEHPPGPDAVVDGAAGLVITSAAAHSVAGPLDAGLPVDRDPGHGADLWAVCLAVVVGGLVLLGAMGLLRRGAVTPARGSPSRLVGSRIIASLLRPPDLSSLCLLRI